MRLPKVIVAHSDRQHIAPLLSALNRRDMLVQFFTRFAANRWPWRWLYRWGPRRVRSQFRKRFYQDVPGHKITHFPTTFWPDQFRGIKDLQTIINTSYRRFDQFVADRLERLEHDIIITFENANRETLREAHRLGKVTVLDLAQIHHHEISRIEDEYYGRVVDTDKRRQMNAYKEEALAETDYIFTISSFAAESLINNGISPERVKLVHLGVDLNRFQPKKDYMVDDSLKCLFVGTVTQRKGIDCLLETFQTLDQYDIELTIIGPLADGQALIEQSRGMFSYHPFMHHEELVKAYQQADVFVFPSYLDSWAQTVVEAMACGTPVIVTEHTGAKDAVRQGGGFIIPPGDREVLREKILHFYHNRADVKRMGEQAAITARQYTWGHYFDTYLNHLTDIAATRK